MRFTASIITQCIMHINSSRVTLRHRTATPCTNAIKQTSAATASCKGALIL
jgi:hypothetical protein